MLLRVKAHVCVFVSKLVFLKIVEPPVRKSSCVTGICVRVFEGVRLLFWKLDLGHGVL